MKISRRGLLATSLGASQLYLLSRFNLLGTSSARAAVDPDRPTKLLTIMVPGGIHHEFLWSIFYDGSLSRFMPPPERRTFYDLSMVQNLDRSGEADADAPIRRIRAPVTWNWESPSDNEWSSNRHPAHGGPYDPKGYAWAAPEYKLYENVAVIHGVDQGTAAHDSGKIASMCGLAGGNFQIAGIPAVVANHFFTRFADDRPIPSVSIRGEPRAPALPPIASTMSSTPIASVRDIEFMLSDRRPNWDGLRARREINGLAFDGSALGQPVPATAADELLLQATQRLGGRYSSGTDAMLEQLYDSYIGFSRTIARDIVDLVASTPGIEHLPEHVSWMQSESRFGWRIGNADAVASDATWLNDFDFILKLLKSDLTTAVSFRCEGLSQFNFDTHTASPFVPHMQNLRGVMDTIARLCIEMKLTPSPTASRPDRTLLDDTLIYITSDFGRSFPISGGSDHNPMHSAVLISGAIQGNRMIGGYRDSALGVPVELLGEEGHREMRPVAARDVASTIYACMGMQAGSDYFIPGQYGVVDGIALT